MPDIAVQGRSETEQVGFITQVAGTYCGYVWDCLPREIAIIKCIVAALGRHNSSDSLTLPFSEAHQL